LKENIFNPIYKEYKDSVYTIACRYLSNTERAMDVAQDIFIKINEKIDKLPPSGELGAYIYRMTVNRCIDILRKVQPLRLLEEHGNIAEHHVPEVEENDEVDFLLSGLNPDQKMAIILKEILGFSVEDTAGACSCDIGTIKSRLSRARDIMRETHARRLARESR